MTGGFGLPFPTRGGVGLNRYTVLRDFTDFNSIAWKEGDEVFYTERQARGYVKNSVIELAEDLTQPRVVLQYDQNRDLVVYNARTGAKAHTIDRDFIHGAFRGPITGSLSGDSFGSHYGVTDGINMGGVETVTVDKGIMTGARKLILINASTGNVNVSVADGTRGQEIVFKAIDVSNDAKVTPANLADGAQIQLATANATVRLQFDGTNWQIVGTTGTVTVT